MFSNIGGKIKSLATVLFWIGVAASLFVGLINLGMGGIIAIIVGCLSSWIGSFFIYGFGQLIENTDKLVAHFTPEESPVTASQPTEPSTPSQSKAPWVCRSCGMENRSHVAFCQQCGVAKAWSESIKE